MLLYCSAGLRATTPGLCGVVLALHLAALGFDAVAVGFAVSLGLAGCAVGTFTVTLVADQWGRRATLMTLAFLMAVGGSVLVWTSHPPCSMGWGGIAERA